MTKFFKENFKFFLREQENVKTCLIREEYQAERIISIARLILMSAFVLELSAVRIFGLTFGAEIPFTPFVIIFILSLFMTVEIWLWGHKRLFKYFNYYVKYIYIFLDLASFAIILYISVKGLNEASVKIWAHSCFFLFGTGLFLAVSIFRYNVMSVIYTTVLLMISFFVTFALLFGETNPVKIIFSENNYNIQSAISIWGLLGISGLCITLTIRIKKILLKSKRQEKLERFLPEIIANDIIKGNKPVDLGGTRQKVTVLFSDIRNFTGFSESHSPEDVVSLLNAYYQEMINLIFKYNGTLDKFIGDGLMAIFGAPIANGQDTLNSVLCAREMIDTLKSFNQKLEEKKIDPIKIGVGIHTGDVILGFIGSQKRMDFTAIGDTVNVASRLENLTKEYNTPIIISGETHDLIKNDVVTDSLGMVNLKGKAEQTEIFRVNT